MNLQSNLSWLSGSWPKIYIETGNNLRAHKLLPLLFNNQIKTKLIYPIAFTVQLKLILFLFTYKYDQDID